METIYDQLVTKGIRLTPLKKQLLQVFQEQRAPLTVPQLQNFLKAKDLTPNKTSLYRHLDAFVKAGILQEVVLGNTVLHYELQEAHHHHFACAKCQAVTCISDESLEDQIHQVAQKLIQKGLRVTDHQFLFSGVCNNCIT